MFTLEAQQQQSHHQLQVLQESQQITQHIRGLLVTAHPELVTLDQPQVIEQEQAPEVLPTQGLAQVVHVHLPQLLQEEGVVQAVTHHQDRLVHLVHQVIVATHHRVLQVHQVIVATLLRVLQAHLPEVILVHQVEVVVAVQHVRAVVQVRHVQVAAVLQVLVEEGNLNLNSAQNEKIFFINRIAICNCRHNFCPITC